MARTKERAGVKAYYEALQRVFELQSEVLTAVLPHMGERGRNDEETFRDFLSKTLPRKFSIGTGFIVCSNPTVPQSNQNDIVIFDEIHNSPLHRELAAFVYPVEMVYATIKVKGRLKPSNLRGCLRSIAKVRRLAKHKHYVLPTAVPVGPSHPGKTALAQIEVPYELSPRAYVLAYDMEGWASLDSFAESWKQALLKNPDAHLHGVAVLKRNWFVYQMAYTAPDVQVQKFSDNALLRFNSKLIKEIQGMAMAPVSSTRYLQLDLEETANKALNSDARPTPPRAS